MSNANNDSSNTNTNIGSRLNNNRKEILIGVQHRGLVPTVVPREASLSNSSLFGAGKLKNRVSGRVWYAGNGSDKPGPGD